MRQATQCHLDMQTLRKGQKKLNMRWRTHRRRHCRAKTAQLVRLAMRLNRLALMPEPECLKLSWISSEGSFQTKPGPIDRFTGTAHNRSFFHIGRVRCDIARFAGSAAPRVGRRGWLLKWVSTFAPACARGSHTRPHLATTPPPSLPYHPAPTPVPLFPCPACTPPPDDDVRFR